MKSPDKKLNDLEKEIRNKKQGWGFGVAWTDQQLQAARDQGAKILIWGEDDNIYFEDKQPNEQPKQ